MPQKELLLECNFFVPEDYEKRHELTALVLNIVKELHDQELGPVGSLAIIDALINFVVKMSNFCLRDSGNWMQDITHKDIALKILDRAAQADKDAGLGAPTPVSFHHELRADLN